ncbi:LppU/SCO3897 family protein [Williamsia sp. SKLECPSW1]
MSGPHDGPDAQGRTPDDHGPQGAPDPGSQPPSYPPPGQYPQQPYPQQPGGAPWYGGTPEAGRQFPGSPYPGGPAYPGGAQHPGGGAQYPGGPAYPGGPQYPGGPVYPGGPQQGFPGGPPPSFPVGPPPWGEEPPRKRRWIKWVAVASVLSLVLIAAVVVAAVYLDSREINDIDDATVGSCITVSGTSDAATPHKANCSADDFSFYVGQKVGPTAQCADDYALHLTQRGKGRLCLTPNMRQGKCYTLPGQSGSVTDFDEVDCSATEFAMSKTVIKVQQRVESAAPGVCSTGEQLSYQRPKPVSYCADVVTSG